MLSTVKAFEILPKRNEYGSILEFLFKLISFDTINIQKVVTFIVMQA